MYDVVNLIISISSIDLRLQSDLFKHTSHARQVREYSCDTDKELYFFQQGSVFSNECEIV